MLLDFNIKNSKPGSIKNDRDIADVFMKPPPLNQQGVYRVK